MNVGQDQLATIAHLSTVIIDRLEKTVSMQNQVVHMDDKNTLEEMQTSLASVLMSIIQRLDKEIQPQADRIMQALLGILTASPSSSIVPDAIFGTVGSLANALEQDFTVYMDAFSPFLYTALGNEQEQQLCSLAIGLVSDIARSIGEQVFPYCDSFMNYLLNNLKVILPRKLSQTILAPLTRSNMQSSTLSQTYKPAILQCFGDIAQAIGGNFETYLGVVMQVLQQASTISAGNTDKNYEMIEYVLSLREGIMDAYDGIVIALKDKSRCYTKYYIGLNTNLILSSTSCAVCGTNIWIPLGCQYGSRQVRSVDEICHGCSWVSGLGATLLRK